MPEALKPSLQGWQFFRALWRLGSIYWTSPDAKWGLLLLGGAIAFELGTVQASVLVSGAQRHTIETLEHHDPSGFVMAAVILVGFTLLSVFAATARIYVRQVLEIRWRRVLTGAYLERWIGPQAYGQVHLHGGEIDNPDQRIAEDVRDFVASALGLSLSLLAGVATLISFGGLLWTLSSSWLIPWRGSEHKVPGLLLWVAIGVALLSMWLTHLLGRRLVPINYDRLRYEADFRYGLVRYRDHTEEVALGRGEAIERLGAVARFRNVVDVFLRLIRAELQLNFLTQNLSQLNSLVPLLLGSQSYFAGLVTLGLIVQTRLAYDQVSGALSWFVNAYREIARWRANIERLVALEQVMDETAHDLANAEIRLAPSEPEAIRLVDLRLECPGGRVVLTGANALARSGDRVALLGAPGRGKTMLFRSVAGIWPFGTGRIERPRPERMLFLPHRPYMPLGTLRAAVTYPSAERDFDDARLRETLAQVGLTALVPRLDEVESWDQQLSAHEKQLLAIARALLHRPEWLLLDEATSDLDEADERRIIELLNERLPHSGWIASGLRPRALEPATQRWRLADGAAGDGVSTLQAA